MNKYELEILQAANGDVEWPSWGSWVGATVEFLQEGGYLTRGGTLNMPRITEAGKQALKEYNESISE